MKCYDKTGLKEHMQVGDADDRSHRGHPLCEFCRKRYLDRDKLFLHLRKDHFFCHICDVEGANAAFYDQYENLREHFLEAHFLCEEGDCLHQNFTNVFPTEIDFKAHKTSMHGRDMTRDQRRQERTIAIEFDYGPTRAEQMRHQRRVNRGRWTGESSEEMAQGRGARYYGGRRRPDEERRGPQAPERIRQQPDDSSLLSAREGAFPNASTPAGAPSLAAKPEPTVEFKVENPEAEFPHLRADASAPSDAGMRRSASQKQFPATHTWSRTGSLGEDEFPTLGGAKKGGNTRPSPLVNTLATSTTTSAKPKTPAKMPQSGTSTKKGMTMMDLNDFPILPGMEVEAGLGPAPKEPMQEAAVDEAVNVVIAGVDRPTPSPSPPSFQPASRADVAGKSFLEILGVNKNQKVDQTWQDKGRRATNLTSADFPGLPAPTPKAASAAGPGAWGAKSSEPKGPRQPKVAPMPEPIDFGVATFTKPKQKKRQPVESKQKNKKSAAQPKVTDHWNDDSNPQIVASTSTSTESKKKNAVTKEHKGDEDEFYDAFPALPPAVPKTERSAPRTAAKSPDNSKNGKDKILQMQEVEPPSSWDYLDDMERKSDEDTRDKNEEQVVPQKDDFPDLPPTERTRYNFDRKKKPKRAEKGNKQVEKTQPHDSESAPERTMDMPTNLKSLGDSIFAPLPKAKVKGSSDGDQFKTAPAAVALHQVPNGDVNMEPPPGLPHPPPPGLGPPSGTNSGLPNGEVSQMPPPGLVQSGVRMNSFSARPPPPPGLLRGRAPNYVQGPLRGVPPELLSGIPSNRAPFYPTGIRFRPGAPQRSRKDESGYIKPEGYTRRKNLMYELVEKDIADNERYSEFKGISGAFHRGSISAEEYIDRLRDLLSPDGFPLVLQELIALLPDIQLQHKLRDADFGKHTKSLQLCDTCYQLLIPNDLSEHRQHHSV